MRGRVHVLEDTNAHEGIDLRRGQVPMAEHGLNEANITAILQHQRRHRVPEEMAGAGLAHLAGIDVATHQLREAFTAEGFAMMRQEEDVPCLIADQKPWTYLKEIALHPDQGTITDGNDSVLLALALPTFNVPRWASMSYMLR